LDAIPNAELTLEEEIELEELIKEMRFRCLSGMLMCLNREQRLVYIIGETFGIDHNIGGEIFNVSKQNFRVKLHRARKDLYNYMTNKCGLANPENPIQKENCRLRSRKCGGIGNCCRYKTCQSI